MIPKIFYVTEKAWNYYPFTITGNFSSVELILSFLSYAEYTVSCFFDAPNLEKVINYLLCPQYSALLCQSLLSK